MNRSISVLTVSFFSSEKIAQLINSLKKETRLKFELLIADNTCGEDENLSNLVELHSKTSVNVSVSLFPMSSNIGYGSAINELVRRKSESITEQFIITNPDVEILPGSIEILIKELRQDPRCGLVGPLILGKDGIPYPSARKFPRLGTGIGHALFAGLWPGNQWTHNYHNVLDDVIEPKEVDWLSGAFLAVSHKAVNEIQGFDEQYFMYFEDVDLSERLSSEGYKRMFVPQSKVLHFGAHSTVIHKRAMQKAHLESAYLYLASHYVGWYNFPTRFALRIGWKLREKLAL